MAVTFEVITPSHPLYEGELDLRFRVLREPLGFPRSAVAFPFEAESVHLVAVEEPGRVVGCVLFHPESPSSGRLFQMAVDPSLQGQGLGRRLVGRLEAELEGTVTEIHLHAREQVVPFYERLGYAVFGEPFVEVSIPHRMMRKAFPSKR